MSSSGRSPATDVLSPTRQQLDELDSLIQQMLSLPVNPVGNETFTAADVVSPPVSMPGQVEEFRGAEDTRPAELPSPPEAFAPPVAEALPLAELPKPQAAEEPPPPAQRPSAPRRRRWTRPVVLPLVWANGIFDGFTYILGPLGRWLRGEAGRAFLGWLGLALLAGAVVWALLD
jgi:hypothetical protein